MKKQFRKAGTITEKYKPHSFNITTNIENRQVNIDKYNGKYKI